MNVFRRIVCSGHKVACKKWSNTFVAVNNDFWVTRDPKIVIHGNSCIILYIIAIIISTIIVTSNIINISIIAVFTIVACYSFPVTLHWWACGQLTRWILLPYICVTRPQWVNNILELLSVCVDITIRFVRRCLINGHHFCDYVYRYRWIHRCVFWATPIQFRSAAASRKHKRKVILPSETDHVVNMI